MTERMGWSLALVCLALGATACSTAHTGENDAGVLFLADTGGTVLIGEDGGGGIVIVPDGALALPDGAFVDRDGGVIGVDAGGTTTRPDSGVVSAHVGDPCTTEADCPGLFCSPGNNGFGYCTWLCTPEMPCPDGAACYATMSGEAGYCMPRCDANDPMSCTSGFLCQAGIVEGSGVCYPGCSSDADCPMGGRCGMGISGVRSCFMPGTDVGDPCHLSSECPELGYCLDEDSWGTPQGLCVTFCDLATHSGCSADTTCVAWGFEGGYGSCVPTCDDASPCRTGYECVSTGAGMPNACVARCTQASDCTAPHACNFVTGRCG